MIAQHALAQAVRQLGEAGVEGAARDARILMAHAMGVPPQRLTLVLQDDLTTDAETAFATAIQRRCQRQPVSHILGQREFYGRSFRVTPDVLDPRPDTETLIKHALGGDFSTVLDLGTGSGCILLTLLAERSGATGVGADISDAALEVATQNAQALGVQDRAQLVRSDWLENVSGQFDLIVSNPPYIDEAEWQTLQPEVHDWEPKGALTPGADGLVPYRVIAQNATRHLAPNGRICVEMGWQQGTAIAEIFTQNGWQGVEIHQDLNGKDRVVTAHRG